MCSGKVCRLEAKVNPPTTPEGIGVGVTLADVAKTYGNSRCLDMGATRFAVEFERLPGVFFISDQLDCEGIEDLQYWERPPWGQVTNVIVGIPK